MPSQAASSANSIAGSTSEPGYQVKLLAALRNGDPALIHPILTELSRDRSKSSDDTVDLAAAALHLAIRCASYDTIQLLLHNRAILPNAVYPTESNTTALHLAASLGRVDIVTLLLEQDGINDTSRDTKGLTAIEVARNKEVRDAIQDSQSLFRASFISLLRTYIFSPANATPPPALLDHLASPRASLLDLSYVDDASGTTLLHEAARRKDLRLVELAVQAGADVFVRDRRGRPVTDAAGKDDRVKAYLRQFTNQDRTLMDTSLTEPPTLKGYLNKYTNVARGYNTRWFVLKDGTLSYYRHQDDENLTCRGSISMTSAILKVSNSGEKLRFEIQSSPQFRPNSHQSHSQHSASISGVQKWYMKSNHPAEAARWTQAIKKSIEWYQNHPVGASFSNHELLARNGSISDVSSFKARPKSLKYAHRASVDSNIGDDQQNNRTDAEADVEDARSLAQSSRSSAASNPPHDTTIELQGNSAVAQLEVTSKLLTSLALPPSTPQPLRDVEAALKLSFEQTQQVVNDYVQMVKERESWFKARLAKELDRSAMWEESMSIVVREGELLERELRKRGRARAGKRRGSFVPPDADDTIRQKPTRALPALPLPDPDSPHSEITMNQLTPTADNRGRVLPSIVLPSPAAAIITHPSSATEEESDSDDEFFDAIESNNLPNLIVSQTLKGPYSPVAQLPQKMDPYQAYAQLRERLPIESDDRPSTSLWQVLKGSIGKDLTRISFPVYFNEPTSMLQRMAEDMEFSECLDAAVAETDPHKRIAFVAAFAMSNYSSTIGRIAKPFNPMLGETFEYVRLDKQYRYYSEQVSHHPPISACWAEAPEWRYYGEVDAQNKFMGKSFEIRPTGVAHAELKLREASEQFEHYTWKKVTTNVSGFILGSTTIDHYGEMRASCRIFSRERHITNHRTNDTCVLTFKPRGWRGKDAFEISGHVLDASGQVTYDIAGRWDSQLVARKSGSDRGALLPNVDVDGPQSPSAPEYILLWRNTVKPKAPFNLTPFALTLNDCPDNTLKPYLPYTDCRLRPDQRAFELGRYDRANELKSQQEDFQRATRKKREEGILPPHRPRWFEAKTDGDTGERVWTPLRNSDRVQYWEDREKVFYSHGKDAWTGVDKIFIDALP
ncbi:Oxysterol-binding protein-domain-containing protein [Hysterangium stoloniferum]|nr:Oxysterol-binding protein-domain-containing protein [Hysterangium stoloniferum]